jgi:predicted permease
LRVALPSTVIKALAGMPLERLSQPPALLPWLLAGLLLLILPPLLRRAAFLGREQARLLLLLIPLGNTSFLGLPLLQAVRGEGALPAALLYDQFGSFPQLLLLGTLLLEKGDSTGRGRWRRLAWRWLSFPPLPALLLALSPAGPWLMETAGPLLHALSATLVPTVMVALGARLRFRLSRADRPALWLGLLGKMAAAPLLALLLVQALGWRGAEVHTALLEAAMPPMATAAAWAGDRGLCPELGASLVSVGILAALAWIPLLSWALTAQGIP